MLLGVMESFSAGKDLKYIKVYQLVCSASYLSGYLSNDEIKSDLGRDIHEKWFVTCEI